MWSASADDKNAANVKRFLIIVGTIQVVVTAALGYVFLNMSSRIPQCVYCMVRPHTKKRMQFEIYIFYGLRDADLRFTLLTSLPLPLGLGYMGLRALRCGYKLYPHLQESLCRLLDSSKLPTEVLGL